MADNTMLRVLIVANKNWEAEPMVGVLAGKRPRPKRLSLRGEPVFPAPVPANQAEEPSQNHPGSTNCAGNPRPRLRLACDGTKPPTPRSDKDGTWTWTPTHMEAEVWCIEDWMTHSQSVSSSSSREKWERALPSIRDGAFVGADGCPSQPDLVLAVGTAGMPSDEVVNGCVTVGSRAFLSDPFWNKRDANSKKDAMLDLSLLGIEAIDGTVKFAASRLKASAFFRGIPDEARLAAEGCFISPPVHPATPPRIFCGTGFASLSTINVTDYDDYIWTDEYTRQRFVSEFVQKEIGSMESTHGLIRAFWRDAAFMFVSGITDRVPLFNQEVTPRVYAQNFVAAHNAGVVVAHLLPAIQDQHADDNLLG